VNYWGLQVSDDQINQVGVMETNTCV